MGVDERRAEYEAQASVAETKAGEAKDQQEAEDWRKIAEAYRLLARDIERGY
jgi:hypothetical protein